jgi:hypothetical protein
VDLGASAQHCATQAPLPGIAQSDIAQLDWIALAIPGCINDALGDHF